MTDLQSRIAQTEREIESLQDRLDDNRAQIGVHVARERPQFLKREDVRETAKALENAEVERDRLDQDAEKINRLLRELEELSRERSVARDNIESLEQDMQGHYEAIGRISFSLYRDNPFIGHGSAEVFSRLVKNREDIQELERELAETERGLDDKPFLEKMVARGKIALVRNRKNTKEGAIPRLLRDAGEQLAQTDFIAAVDDPELNKAAEPFLQLKEQYEKQHERLGEIEEERSDRRAQLEELGASERHYQKALDELHRKKEQQDDRIRRLHAEIGREYLAMLEESAARARASQAPGAAAGTGTETGQATEQPEKAQDSEEAPGTGEAPEAPAAQVTGAGADGLPESLLPVKEEIDKQSADLERLQKWLGRLRAASEVERLDAELERLNSRAGDLGRQLEDVQRRLDDVNSSIKQTQQERKRQEKLRGPIKDFQ